MRREAWRQRFTTRESSAAAAPAAAVTSVQCPAQIERPAAPGAATPAPATAAVTPPRVWEWQPRDGLLVVARRLQEDHLESPETARCPEFVSDFNISLSSSPEEREPVEVCSRSDSYAAAAARATTAPSANLGMETPGEAASAAEERMEVEERSVGVEPVFRLPPTPPPWSKHFSSHPRRVLCTFCFSGKREIWNAKCSDCYRIEREELKKQRESNLKK